MLISVFGVRSVVGGCVLGWITGVHVFSLFFMLLRGFGIGSCVVRSVANFKGTATTCGAGGVGMRVGSLGDGGLSLSAHVTPLCERGRVRVHRCVTGDLRENGVSFSV